MPLPPVCPICAAVLLDSTTSTHLGWHEATHTLNGWTLAGAELRLREQAQWERLAAGDDAPTAKLPPITDTVRRRPPVPPSAEVRELRGADLLRALAHQLEREDLAELDREDQGDDDAGDPA